MAADKRARKDLDAARMRGDLPPEEDAAGHKINPHIPEFMAKAPWYLAKDAGPSLAHQRLAAGGVQSISALEPLFRRGETGARATRFRAGACRNCGAATHAERDCVERPRRVGAWKSGTDIAPDEVAPGVATAGLRLGWDAKRDAYAGYDAASHASALAAKFGAAEAERTRVLEVEREKLAADKAARKVARVAARKARCAARRSREGVGSGCIDAPVRHNQGVKAAACEDDAATASSAGGATGDEGVGSDSSFDSSDDEDVAQREHTERVDGVGAGELGSKAKMTSWNVRVREDTAKYLLNLDVESAFYDPKTRSMRENPFEGSGKDPASFVYAGDNAWRNSGQTLELAKAELFAWQAYNAGGETDDTHLQANPTQAEFLRQQAAQRNTAVVSLQQQRMLAQYGGETAGGGGSGAIILPPDLRMGATEAYTEYGGDGRPLRAAPAPMDTPSSAPAIAATVREACGSSSALHGAEDLHPGNHASVWGSWFDRGAMVWGYACCHAVLRSAYCTRAPGTLKELVRGVGVGVEDAPGGKRNRVLGSAGGEVDGSKRHKRPEE